MEASYTGKLNNSNSFIRSKCTFTNSVAPIISTLNLFSSGHHHGDEPFHEDLGERPRPQPERGLQAAGLGGRPRGGEAGGGRGHCGGAGVGEAVKVHHFAEEAQVR